MRRTASPAHPRQAEAPAPAIPSTTGMIGRSASGLEPRDTGEVAEEPVPNVETRRNDRRSVAIPAENTAPSCPTAERYCPPRVESPPPPAESDRERQSASSRPEAQRSPASEAQNPSGVKNRFEVIGTFGTSHAKSTLSIVSLRSHYVLRPLHARLRLPVRMLHAPLRPGQSVALLTRFRTGTMT